MKNLSTCVLGIALTICSAFTASATVRTVNNGSYLPTNPGQYSTISAAISASSAGDTILVAGSLTPYTENVTLNVKLTIIGAGFNPQYGPSSVINGNLIFNSTNCSGSTVMGFQITNEVTDQECSCYYQNITFFRNYISDNQGLRLWATHKNFTAKENVFNGPVYLMNGYFGGGPDTFTVIENNIFLSDNYINENNINSSMPQMIIDHNLFLSGSYSSPSITNYSYVIQTINALLTNNIFYNVVPIDTNNGSQYTNNTFNNNLTFCSTTIKALPWGGNTGVANLNNTNPLFTSIFTSSSSPALSFNNDNLRPQAGSPVMYAATDSTNIGPTGGVSPIYDNTRPYLSGEPPIPMVETITPTSSTSVNPGTPFVIQVTAKQIK